MLFLLIGAPLITNHRPINFAPMIALERRRKEDELLLTWEANQLSEITGQPKEDDEHGS